MEVKDIEELKNISFKVPKEFYIKIKRRLLDVDKNLKQYVIDLIENDLIEAEKDKK